MFLRGVFHALGLWAGVVWAEPASEVVPESGDQELPRVFADPSTTGTDEDLESWEPDEGLVVFGDGVDQARGELDRTIRAQGYYRGERRGDRTVYLARQAWKPKVVVYDAGFMVLRRGPVRLGMPREAPPWTNLLCPLALPACVRIGGQIISPRKLEHQRSRVIEGMDTELQDWREALVRRAFQERLDDLPERLDRVWHEGVPLVDGEERLVDRQARRQALLAFWQSRAHTPEGTAVRRILADYLTYEVQPSDWPVSPGEQERANRGCGCAEPLDLPFAETTTEPDPGR